METIIKSIHSLGKLSQELGLVSVPTNVEALQQVSMQENWTFEESLCALLDIEYERRLCNRQKARLATAGFSQMLYLEDLNRQELPAGVRNVLPELETLSFIHSGRNIVLYGNPGTGKTHIATGLGIRACKAGMTVLYTSVPHLITQIKECRSLKTLHQLEKRFEKYDLVICDEFGYISCDKEGGELLFNHLSLRAGKKSTIITTNLSFDRWGEIIKDKVLVTAMVDRLTHQAYLINMNGTSYRLKQTQALNMPKMI